MNEESLVQRAAEERAAIVAKYKHGRQEGAKIDPWEDPSLEIYHVLDRYGFIRDKNDKHYSDEAIKETAYEAQVKVEMERVKKWVKMLAHWDHVIGSEKLKRRVFKGIPNSLRGRVWSKMLNLEKCKGDQQGKYQEMCQLAWNYSSDIRQIDLDVNRTYRDHIMFRERYNLKQQELFNVLGAYSVYNSEIGYCQGMSQIAALLLMYLDEEDAFWALNVLVSDKKYNMHGFFIPGFPKLLRYQEHHDKIMNKFLPKLKKHLDKNGVDTGIYTLKWFFQCFLDRIPFKLTLRVWDVYLLIGERILTAMAYNLLKLHRRTLLRLGMDEILQFLQVQLERKFEVDDDIAMESLSKCLEELKKNKLDFVGPAPPNELPQRQFGVFKEPPVEQKEYLLMERNYKRKGSVGRRSMEFSHVEKSTRDSISLRRDTAAAAALIDSPRNSASDETVLPGEGYGINKNEYSGIGKLKVLDNTGLPIPIARTHHHLKTGLHRNPEPPVSEKAMLNIIKGNVGLFADSISKIGPELFNLSRSHMSKPLPKLAEKQLFPRSIVFELDYTKAVNRKAMLEALEKERALFEQAFEEKKAALLNKEKQKIEKAKLKDRELPTNNKEYEGRKKLEVPKEKLKESEKKNTITLEKKLENEKCTSVCGPCGCVLVRGVCPKCLKTELKVYEAVSQKEKGWKEECKIWPSEKPRYGSSWGEQRKTELLRVSYPFAKEAAAWLYCTIKPLDCSMLNRPSKKRFPERSFSSLNI